MKKKWKCGVCGYIHDGDEAPAKCVKCGAPKEKFVLLDEKAANLVERSRRTNSLHGRLLDLARQIELACNQGIEDDLDPGCVDVFKKSREMSWQIMKLAMAEMAGHVSKGKWG
ncbi:MAG: rubredoxin-like domain-containing protein [Candidatus Eisenbacteria bacterium]